ncbi:lysophospholipid acyltransferase family protein [Streptomyces sp. NPDC054796]
MPHGQDAPRARAEHAPPPADVPPPTGGTRLGAHARRLLWRGVLRLTGGLRVEGRRHVPRGGCVVVAPHASHADTAALLAALPARRRPLVAAAADYWFAGRARATLCRRLVAGFPVRRGGRGFGDLAASAVPALARGQAVVVFPEGTRSRDGSVGRFRSGATRLAELADVPLLPVGLVGTRTLLPAHGRLRRTRVTVRFGPPTRDPETAWRTVCVLGGLAAQTADGTTNEKGESPHARPDQPDQHDRFNQLDRPDQFHHLRRSP